MPTRFEDAFKSESYRGRVPVCAMNDCDFWSGVGLLSHCWWSPPLSTLLTIWGWWWRHQGCSPITLLLLLATSRPRKQFSTRSPTRYWSSVSPQRCKQHSMDRKKWVKAWIDEEGGGCRGGGCARLMVPPLPNGRDRTQLLVYWLGGRKGFTKSPWTWHYPRQQQITSHYIECDKEHGMYRTRAKPMCQVTWIFLLVNINIRPRFVVGRSYPLTPLITAIWCR